MPEYISDQERDEEARESREIMRKKEMDFDEIMECPTWDCDGGPEVWSTGIRTPAGELWCVGCPKCKGWVSQFLIDGGQDPYTIGAKIWEEMRREPEK